MTIVSCPQCNRRISSLAPICDNCGYAPEEAGEEDVQRFRERRLRTRIYRLNMATYGVMATVFLAFAWHWAATGGFEAPASTRGPLFLMMVSGVVYLVVRVLLYRARAQRREIWRGD